MHEQNRPKSNTKRCVRIRFEFFSSTSNLPSLADFLIGCYSLVHFQALRFADLQFGFGFRPVLLPPQSPQHPSDEKVQRIEPAFQSAYPDETDILTRWPRAECRTDKSSPARILFEFHSREDIAPFAHPVCDLHVHAQGVLRGLPTIEKSDCNPR
ncbi:predicted protein [Plenodomus lingam JN3]|uniref:Predicted protein n=1 Tax=Leptosphaeria maculans (strain JN3 / isolate v23.1.3 / race Av1-4-5-6-7-8) TaxID=985895 RepID=E5A5K4_LEPMJ|nr:predicted protein [Plenodomus lingam JN3]CBX98902.1 predicted protein [Plenodomus lingam JN3]